MAAMPQHYELHDRQRTRVGLVAVALVSAVAVLVSAPRPSLAQSPVSPTPVAATVQAAPSTSAATETLTSLRDKYRQQLAVYRDSERAFTIANQQYQKLKTLAALEELVTATRAVMLARILVLETYTTLVQETLKQTSGIELQRKNEQVRALGDLVSQLKQHQLLIEASTDRTKLADAAAIYTPLHQIAQEQNHKAMGMIATGRVQTMFDQVKIAKNIVSAYVDQTETNSLRKAEKQRGLAEVERNLTATGADLEKITAEDAKAAARASVSSFPRLIEQLTQVYGGVTRTLTYLQEVVQP